jgi:hypothetical protein
MELNITALDLLPAATQSQLHPCESTCMNHATCTEYVSCMATSA